MFIYLSMELCTLMMLAHKKVMTSQGMDTHEFIRRYTGGKPVTLTLLTVDGVMSSFLAFVHVQAILHQSEIHSIIGGEEDALQRCGKPSSICFGPSAWIIQHKFVNPLQQLQSYGEVNIFAAAAWQCHVISFLSLNHFDGES